MRRYKWVNPVFAAATAVIASGGNNSWIESAVASQGEATSERGPLASAAGDSWFESAIGHQDETTNDNGQLDSSAEDMERGVARLPKLLEEIPMPTLPNIPGLPSPSGIVEQAWAEAGRYAYPAAAKTMRKRHEGREEPLSHVDRIILRKFFGSLPDRVSVFWAADPLDRWKAGKYFIPLSNVDTEAQAYGRYIYVRHAQENMAPLARLKLIAHELVHVQQYERFGSLSEFGYQYFLEYKRANFVYDNNNLEEEADGQVDENQAFLAALEAEYKDVTTPPTPLCLVGVEGVLTFSNPTGAKIYYKFQWDEDLPWKEYWLEPNHFRTHAVTNGCGGIARNPKIRFDHSFESGFQYSDYDLQYNDQPEPANPAKRPFGMVFSFVQLGNSVDLRRQGSI